MASLGYFRHYLSIHTSSNTPITTSLTHQLTLLNQFNPSPSILSPMDFFQTLIHTSKETAKLWEGYYQQQDAHELYQLLLMSLDREIRTTYYYSSQWNTIGFIRYLVPKKENSEGNLLKKSHIMGRFGMIHDLIKYETPPMKGLMGQRLWCLSCNYKVYIIVIGFK